MYITIKTTKTFTTTITPTVYSLNYCELPRYIHIHLIVDRMEPATLNQCLVILSIHLKVDIGSMNALTIAPPQVVGVGYTIF